MEEEKINVGNTVKSICRNNKIKILQIPITDGLEETVIAVSDNEIRTTNPWRDMFGNTEYFLNVYLKNKETDYVKFTLFSTKKEYDQNLNLIKQSA